MRYVAADWKLNKRFPEHGILMNHQTAETMFQHTEIPKPLGPMVVKGDRG
jgi:hypothetical protein